jgi:hypothetical protein
VISAFLGILLLLGISALLRQHAIQQQRTATQRNLPRELLLPRHYKSYVEVENQLWAATRGKERSAEWVSTRIKLRAPELSLVRQYVRGLRTDFTQGNRTFSALISRAPDAKTLKELEFRRIKMEVSYYVSYFLVRIRLLRDRVSPTELQRLTQSVASLAYELRSMLSILEKQGHIDFLESLLRNY